MTRRENLRRDFVANVSHELRTPVAVIRANAETLLEGAIAEPEQAHKFVEGIERNAARLTDLISDLLDLSRIEAGNYGLTLRRMRVAKAVGRAVDDVGRLARRRTVELVVQVPGDLQVVADKRGLDQILINLLDNAVKHTPEGAKVVVRAKPASPGVRIEVEDEGPGVEPRHRDRIFERFFRGDRGRSRDKGGTGLGLAIVKHLTDLMNGFVGVKSGPVGAVFWLVLPGVGVDGSTDVPPAGESQPGTRLPTALPPEAQRLEGALRRLRKRLVRMASRAEGMVGDAVGALLERDTKLAERTIRADDKVDRDEIKGDKLCVWILDQYRPESSDVRFITVALKMIGYLERIGDLAVDISGRALLLRSNKPLRQAPQVKQLTAAVRAMLRDAIDSFVDGDVDKAIAVVASDDEVDELYRQVTQDLLDLLRSNPKVSVDSVHVLSVVEALERIGDNATNIAEQTVFLAEGRDIRHAEESSRK